MDLIYDKRKQNKQTNLNLNVFISLLFSFMVISLTSCQESIEKRAAKEAKDYTERCCPTPVVNCSRTDSVTFDEETRTYTYYCSFVDQLDDQMFVDANHKKLKDGLHETIYNNAGLKPYIDKGFKFTYIIRSGRDPKRVLFKETFTK